MFNPTTLNSMLAWRFFSGGRQSALVSFISSISIIGMTLAVSLLVLVLSVMNGFEQEFKQRILGLAPHARIWFEVPRDDFDALINHADNDNTIAHSLPFVEFKALAVAGTAVQPLLVQGTDIERFLKIASPYVSTIVATASRQAGGEALSAGEIILGAQIAAKLALGEGSKIRLLIVDSNSNETMSRPKIHAFTVAGVINTGTELDNGIGLLNLSDAANIKRLGQHSEGLQFQVGNVFEARRIARQFAIQHGIEGHLSDWTQDYGNLYTAIQLSRQLVVLLLASIIGVAVFNIFITLGMVVRHKRPEIAMLRTMGMRRSKILAVFIWQGLLISLPGCVAGLLLGSVFAWLAPSAVDALQTILQIEFLSTDVYPINYLPSQVRLSDLGLIAVIALAMSFMAVLIPAWKAATLQPARVLNSQD